MKFHGIRISLPVLMLAIASLVTTNCGDSGLVVNLANWPEGAEYLRIRTSLDGSPGVELRIPKDQTRFLVALPAGKSGLLFLDATALDGGNCKIATAQIQEQLGGRLARTQEQTLVFTLLPIKVCTLTVTLSEDGGSVSSVPPGLVCGPGTATCEVDFPANSTVQLSALFDSVRVISPLWSGDCNGSGNCSVLLDRSRYVQTSFAPRICGPEGFCWYNPLPSGNASVKMGTTSYLTDVKGDGSGTVWAVGVNGAILNCSRAGCLAPLSGTANQLNRVWVNGSEVWAVGFSGTLLKCSNAGCLVISSGTLNNFYTIGGSGSGTVWIAGQNGAVLKCSGTQCSSITSGTNSQLNGLWVSSSGEAWAVGTGGTVLKCSGTSCSTIASGTMEYLSDVWGSGNGEVWVSGFTGTMLKCSGTSCSSVSSGTSSQLNGVWVSGVGEAWAVGPSGMVVKCSGTSCSLIASGTTDGLDRAFGSGNGEMWAVSSSGTLIKCSGTTCSSIISGLTSRMTSVSSTASEIWVAGADGTVLRYAP